MPPPQLRKILARMLYKPNWRRYWIGDGIVIWIITEADRCSTTIMLPDGYQGQSGSTQH
jgi:hypothetical protein